MTVAVRPEATKPGIQQHEGGIEMKLSDGLRARSWSRTLAGVAVAALLVGTVQSAAQAEDTLYGPGDPAAQSGGTLNFGSLVEPPALDPYHQGSDARLRISVLMYQGLMYEGGDGVAQPLLAESYEVSDDGKTYTFKLGEGVTFHTGQPMTAEDVKYSYDYIRYPANGSPGAGDYAAIESIDVVDDHTVRFNLSQPNAALLMTLTNKFGGVIPKGYFDSADAQTRMNQASVGTGPFMLQAFQPNSYLTLVRNPDYWQEGLPYLDQINFTFVPNSASVLVALRSDRVDLAVLERPQDAEQVEGVESLVVERWPSLNQKSIDLGLNYGPLGDVRVRQAIASAVDKEEIMQAAIGGYGQVIGTIVAGMQDRWGLPVDDVAFQGVNVERGKALLAEAGYSDGLNLDLVTIIGYDWMDPAAVTLAEQLKKIGIRLNITKVDLGVWIQHYRARDMRFTFNDWGTTPDPSLLYYRHFRAQPKGADFRQWNNQEASALLDRGQEVSNPKERKDIYLEFQRILAEQVPTIMMFSSDLVTVQSERVRNFHQHPTGWYFGLVKTWLAQE
jgi:peptide/nickel transport system substrate-binding protein